MGENDAAGVINQNEYQALQYYFGEGGVNVHMWGTMLDTGGDCSNYNSSTFGGSYCPRPQMLGAQVYNWCKIGPMVQTSWTSNPTYNLPANTNSVNAINGVPVLRSYAFAQGNQRCMVIVNADVYSAHNVTFAGTNAPASGVTTYQFAPGALNTVNEASALTATSTLETPMGNTTTPGVSVASGYSLPAHSVTAFMWETNGTGSTATAGTPTFSPAGGTFSSAQTVTLYSSTSGATIYYTTNGTTPSTSSTKYTGPIAVSATETIQAIAVVSGDNNSAVGSATYTINDPVAAAPTFSLASGTYSPGQSVSLSDATAGATIYYTTNGTTPSTSSTKYTGTITVNATETIEAIAVVTGYTNSAVSSATYTMYPKTATPVLSLASGTYNSAQTVTIADATSGAVIYYTTNGSTPTTSSAKYSGPITVSTTETVNAVALATGYLTSPLASATYTISSASAGSGSTSESGTLPAPTFSVAAGTYTSAQTVSITDATAGATIYYTTNGTAPTTSSTKYTGPLTVSTTETIETIAVASGYTNSPIAAASYVVSTESGSSTVPTGSVFTFNSFAGSQSQLNLNGNAKLDGSKLQLTDGGLYENSTAWYGTPVSVKTFTTDVTFQLTNAVADGFTFTVQGYSPHALGAGGAGLGYANLPSSVGLKFYLHSIGNIPESTGLYTNGAAPFVTSGSINLQPSGIKLTSGDVMTLHLVYDGTTLTMTLTDTVTKVSFTHAFTVNIPSTVGSSNAYVGFTGASGGAGANQQILSWSYSN